MRSLVLRQYEGLGDLVMLSALARDLHQQYSADYRLHVRCNWPNLFVGMPVSPLGRSTKATPGTIDVKVSHTGLVNRSISGTKAHAVRGFAENLSSVLGRPLLLTRPSGHIVLTADELRRKPEGRYWVIVVDGKRDMPVKLWPRPYWEDLVARLTRRGIVCVQSGSSSPGHYHRPLPGALSAIGKTQGVREFAALIAGADGVICGITAAMHMAAVFDRPCVVIAGGREEPWYYGYRNDWPGSFGVNCAPVAMPHVILDTVGSDMDCCRRHGCRRRKVVPDRPEGYQNPKVVRQLCVLPETLPGSTPTAQCMNRITAEQVEQAVLSYYESGAIAPIDRTPLRLPDWEVEMNATPAATPLALVEMPSFTPTAADTAAIENPIIGGKLTVLVLCYGEHTQLAKRCLGSILTSLGRERMDLRVACNECCRETLDYVASCNPDRLYVHQTNRHKYPVMREMLRDKNAPVTTSHFVWFDDDSYVVRADWAHRLSARIVERHPHGARMYGWRQIYLLQVHMKGGHDPMAWFRASPWWRGREFPQRAGTTSGAKPIIPFIPGSFWAMETATALALDLPEPRISHCGGDAAVGAVLYQHNIEIADFNRNGQYVHMSKAQRRGYSEKHPWAPPVREVAPPRRLVCVGRP